MSSLNESSITNMSDSSLEKSTSSYIAKEQIGSDDCGATDFFGPLCVVACYIKDEDVNWLSELVVEDPKGLTNKEIVALAKQIKDRIVYSLLILDNSHYNQMAANGLNLANIRTRLHNQAVINIMQKINKVVDTKVINQFVSQKTYYNYLKNEVIVVRDLKFVQEANKKYLSVFCANILAQYAFLQYFTNMSKSLKVKLPRGTTASNDAIAVAIAKKYGTKMLNKVTKTNMTNYKRVCEAIKKAKS